MTYNVVAGRNVCENFATASNLIGRVGVPRESRAGQVLVAPGPVLTVTERPQERVLFASRRNANPFFHLFESIWMLAGCQDGVWLDQFVGDFTSRFAEPGTTTLHGAYGHRWRRHFLAGDQLKHVADRLTSDKTDRRSVIQMWSADDDLYNPTEIDDETGLPFPEPRDTPCNTHAYTKVRDDGRLTLTVSCRSNDIVWGCYGANAVHFSVLHEWLAAAVGAKMGPMYQLSDDWHVYDSTRHLLVEQSVDPYSDGTVEPEPMFSDPSAALTDCETFTTSSMSGSYHNPWFETVAIPMLYAHDLYKEGDFDAALEAAGGGGGGR